MPCPQDRFFGKIPQAAGILEDSDFNKLINSMDTCALASAGQVIIQLLLDSGMRIGECLNVKDKDLSLETNAIFLPAENTKGKKDRYVFFGNKMARQLRQWLQFRDRYKTTDFLFCTNEGKPLQVSNFEANVRKNSKRAGLENIIPMC
jgi:integrase/recombinase XerD